MTLTRKDFNAVAAIIKAAGPQTERPATKAFDMGFTSGAASAQAVVALKMADYLATTNSRFDRPRFLKACGLEDAPSPFVST